MSIGSDFKTYAKTIAAITTLIGAGAEARIFDRVGKQGGNAPWILYFVAGGQVERHLGGLSGAAQTILQTWCYGNDTDEADTLDAAVRSSLVGSSGLGGRGAMGSTTVLSIQDSAPFWDEDLSKDKSDSYRPFVRRVYTITHTEATT